jgi:hypothetical protein
MDVHDRQETVVSVVPGADTERRIAWLTPLLGLAAAAIVLAIGNRDWAEGLLIGTALAWLNFRWLRRGLDVLVAASAAQHGREKPRVPLLTYFTAIFRYGLLAFAVYVIFIYLHLPLASMVVGLCALGTATIAASVWEILVPETTARKERVD